MKCTKYSSIFPEYYLYAVFEIGVFVWRVLMKGQVEAQVSPVCVKISVQGRRGIFVTLNLHWFNCIVGRNDLDPNSSSGLVHVHVLQDCPWVALMRQDLLNFLTSGRPPPDVLLSCLDWYDLACEDAHLFMVCK